ncbi:nad-dependent 15-hydroxyprostaglandin dehydrogenase [Seiridium cupressi]
MPWDLKGKVAIVTGAGSGTSVIFADIALRPEAEATLAKFPHPSEDGRASSIYHKMDQIDLLCPGAGIWKPPSSSFWHAAGTSPFAKDDPNGAPGVYNVFAVNVMGPIRFSQIAIDYWLGNKIAGNLIFVASQSAYLPTIGTPLYSAGKGALTTFTQSFAQLKARLNIRVTAMCPSVTYTSATQLDHCKSKIRDFDMNMTATECAEVMLRMVTEEEYGNGDVVEAMQFGKGKSDVRVRKIPYHNLRADIDFNGEFSGKNIMAEEEKLYEQLKTKGMRP